MNCDQARALLSDYVDGTLAGPDLDALSDHVRRCRDCAADADGLRETIALLRGLPPWKAPPGLMEGISAGFAREGRKPSLWRTLFLPVHVKIPLEAAAAVLLFLLVYGIPGMTTRTDVAPASSPRTAISSAASG